MKLKEYIDKYCVKQAVLARRAKVCQQTLIRAIRGEYITYRTASKISKATNGEVTPFMILASAISIDDHGDATDEKKKEKKTAKTKKSKLSIPAKSDD